MPRPTRRCKAIELALDRVSNLNEDRVLRQLLALIQATLRTNHWRTGVGHSGAAGPRRSFLSFKFDSAQVPGLPSPRPLYEIFVYSPRFEGIHLRGGKVARGGLRWSDRPEDFRTEVLGLVKAQMVKNTVIVPVGSQGRLRAEEGAAGRRPRGLPEGRRGLLPGLPARAARPDRQPGRPARWCRRRVVRRLDGDDPYLVVAADKGTATFSDHANAISAEYGHWLGDAFASGGSVGYDHKAMGITARGAWESVKRHFRELGLDTQSSDFTVVGVGDMSGDVFGNGMLLSRAHPAGGRLRPPPCVHRPEPDAARILCRARTPVQAAALVLGRLRRQPDLRRRRRLVARREVDPAVAAGARGAGHRGRGRGARLTPIELLSAS